MSSLSEPIAQSSAPTRGLAARLLGVVFSPRSTYASVAAHPASFGVLAFVVLVSGAATLGFLSTDVGQSALIDIQRDRMASLNRPMTDEQVAQMERFAPIAGYVSAGTQLVLTPIIAAALAGIGWAIFNAMFGGQATFAQTFAVVSHSLVLVVLQVLFTLPLNFARQSLASTTSLAVFLPMLEEPRFLVNLLGAIDLFRIWWLISLAIGFAVLYRKRTGPIAASFLAVYGAIAVAIAAVLTALSGA
jgi:hypothetical protein